MCWVSVKDAMPEKGQIVLAIGKKGALYVGVANEFPNGVPYIYVPNRRNVFLEFGSIKAWMPVPDYEDNPAEVVS